MLRLNNNYDLKTKPFEHQEDAINFIAHNKNVAIFDEQGLGKTKIIIDSLAFELKSNNIDLGIIVCKKTLMENWREEIETHSNLKAVIIKENKTKRGNFFMVPSHFVIIGYETAINESRTLKQLMKIKRSALVLDESHKIKNINSKVSKELIEIGKFATQRIIMSGTPVANKPEDLWAQFYFLDQGDLLGDNFDKFKSEYCSDDEESLNRLRSKINEKSIRRLKNDVLELPDKVYKNIIVNMNKEQQQIYDDLKEKLITEITGMNDEEIIDESENILKKLLRLTQVASNPWILNKKYKEIPGKFLILDKEIEKIDSKNEKVIIWSSFVENIILLKNRYKDHKSVTIYGKMTIDQRNDAVKKFKQDPDCKVMIANPAAAREGLTLTVANNVIYLDRNFNLVDYLQSQDRIHRISQTKKCNIILLIAENSVDEYIDEMIYKKNNVARYIQGDTNIIKKYKLTKDEIINILED